VAFEGSVEAAFPFGPDTVFIRKHTESIAKYSGEYKDVPGVRLVSAATPQDILFHWGGLDGLSALNEYII
jgi:hypothetical protein